MKLTSRLLGLLNRVFDIDPERFLALRLNYSGTSMTWAISDGVLTTTVSDGPGAALSVDLSQYTIRSLVDYLSAQPGYSVAFLTGQNSGLSALVLMDGSGDQGASNGDHLYGYSSLLWAIMEPAASELTDAQAQVLEAPKQMSVATAEDIWLDEIGSYFGVLRNSGEVDTAYGPRIVAEVVRPKCNNVAIEKAISYYTGQATTVRDVTVYGAAFPKYNSAITRNSAYNYQPSAVPQYGLFDVEYGYDLLGDQSPTAFAATITSIINRIRAAGTHMRSLLLKASTISDDFTAPTDGGNLALTVNPALTDSFTAPTDPTLAVATTLSSFSDTADPGSEGEFNAFRFSTLYNSVRTRNSKASYRSGELETSPALAKDWDFMTGVLPGDVTFSRASTATYFDRNGVLQVAAADTPRFDFDPATGKPLGLLIEEARTNNMLYSEEHTASSWTKSLTTVEPSTAVAPDGSFMQFLRDNTTNDLHSIYQSRTVSVSTAYVYSVHLKQGSRRYAFLNIGTSRNSCAVAAFDLQTGTVLRTYDNGSTWAVISAGVINAGNGIWRVWIAAMSPSSGTSANPALWIVDDSVVANAIPTYAGTGTGIYLWGDQFEQGTFPTSYIPVKATFTSRASSATYFDSNGVLQTVANDVARSAAYLPDANGVMRPAGLLVEGAATNMCQQSGSPNLWLPVSAVISAENDNWSGMTPVRVASSGADWHRLRAPMNGSTSALSGQVAGTLFYVAGTSGRLLVNCRNVATAAESRISGVIGALAVSQTAAGALTLLDDRRIRGNIRMLRFAFTPINNTDMFEISFGPNSAGVGDDVVLYGCQLEYGSVPSSFIFTAGANVTRAADVTSSAAATRQSDVASATLGAYFNATEGTLLGEADVITIPAVAATAFSFVNGTSISERVLALQFLPNLMRGGGLGSSGVDTAIFNANGAGAPVVGVPARGAIAFAQDNANGAVNGVLSTADTATPMPAVTAVYFGRLGASAQILNGHVRRLTYWSSRFPDGCLKTMSAA